MFMVATPMVATLEEQERVRWLACERVHVLFRVFSDTAGAHVWPTVESLGITPKFTTGDQRLAGLLRCLAGPDYQYGVSRVEKRRADVRIRCVNGW